ncbi:glycoside hydrolase family 78 protein [Lachnospiraceae bacterium OttesenSCG-928-D06]|nr:glycoside hydrolase family 78 protein [Lachnospiraceae bacterium OttesenSCG-928-D06]
MEWNGKWICPNEDTKEVCPLFVKNFKVEKAVKKASLFITAIGVYEAFLSGKRIGDFILAPGFTAYKKRLQYQEYDVTSLLKEENTLSVTLGLGWYRGRLGWENCVTQKELKEQTGGILAQLKLEYADGSVSFVSTDESWLWGESNIRFSEIYDGETYDASFQPQMKGAVSVFQGPSHTLIPQQGEEIKEQEVLYAAELFYTSKGELVIDFGQEITGYIEVTVDAKEKETVLLSHAEVMDKEGNFYTENYRSAKAQYCYICKEGKQNYKPHHTFYGFRYIRVDKFPGNFTKESLLENPTPLLSCFRAIVVHSDMERTGYLSCSNQDLNQLFDNVIWGQKGNFLDIPTDCPQRDERLGWTGDAQVFVKTAALNYNVERFFTKWLADMAADQGESGYIAHVIPNIMGNEDSSAAWADAATICPFEIYLAYGNSEILENQFDCMTKWVDYVENHSNDAYLFTGQEHFGDWLGLDAPSGSYKGSSREDFIASAFYAYSTSLVVKSGKILGRDVSKYENLYQNIVNTFRSTYEEYYTQTECVLAVHFNLAKDPQKTADQLAAMVEKAGVMLQTGFVGTPYLLHALSSFGHEKLAYSLLLRKDYPSWLYPVTKGATTIWEHWDGIMENGDFWSPAMNSYNHYAYGAVADWVYSVAAGIKPIEAFPGYEKVSIKPIPDERLDWLKASLSTKHGLIRSEWKKEGNLWRFEIETPTPAFIQIGETSYEVEKGTYLFYHLI